MSIEYNKKYRERNIERIRANEKVWREKNKVKIASYRQTYIKKLKTDAVRYGEFKRKQKKAFADWYRRNGTKRAGNKRIGVRFKVLMRDSFTCRYCGAKAPEVRLHVDHVLPKSKGGKWEMSNLVAACEFCNVGKRDIILDALKK